MIKAEELAKKMRKQRCHHCKDGRSFDGQFIFCGNKGLFSLHFCPGCGAPLTENGEEILVGRLNEALTCEDAKKERYIWFTPLNDWAKVTSFGVLFFGSEELMSWETLCEEWGYRFKAYRRPPEGEDNEKTNT